MATTFEKPAMPNGAGGRSRGFSHSRKMASQMDPSQFAAMNGTKPMNGSVSIPSVPRIQESPHHHSTSSTDTIKAMPREPSNTQLPIPPSFSTPTRERSKSWERRKSVGQPPHLSLKGVGYGIPIARDQTLRETEVKVPGAWVSGKELLSVSLVTIPYVLASVAYSFGVAPQLVGTTPNADRQGKITMEHGKVGVIASQSQWESFKLTAELTSATLIFAGLHGRYIPRDKSSDRRNSDDMSATPKSIPITLKISKGALRALSVGLPFYATSILGIRVALLLTSCLLAEMFVQDRLLDPNTISWRQMLWKRKLTLAAIALQMVFDLAGLTNGLSLISIFLAYVAFGLSCLLLPSLWPTTKPYASQLALRAPFSFKSMIDGLSTRWEAATAAKATSLSTNKVSPLTCTTEDTNLTTLSGASLALFVLVLGILSEPGAGANRIHTLLWGFPTALGVSLSLTMVDMHSLQSSKGLGFLIVLFPACFLLAFADKHWAAFAYQLFVISLSVGAANFDRHAASHAHSHHHHHHHHDHQHDQHSQIQQHHSHGHVSKFTEAILLQVRGWPLLHSILVEKDSRRIFYFMCLNFAFMIVQTFYGIATGSLGLLSDSIHMFFDCLALVVGLCAAVMSKWPPSSRFPYGFGKMETLSGFANGIFLMLISVEIVYEALERLAEGNKIQRLGELLTVSALGLIVNVIGMAAFGHAHHGHGHSHDHGHGHDHNDHDHSLEKHSEHGHHHHHHNHDNHGHSHHPNGDLHAHECDHHDHTRHDHSHHNHNGNPSPENFDLPPLSAVSHSSHLLDPLSTGPTSSPSVYSSVPATPSKPAHPHSFVHAAPSNVPPHHHDHNHNHRHHHHHGNENMEGIFLHVLADTLGSVAVVISTLLIHYIGWSGFDPIASCLIAILIFASAIPLVKTSASKLLLAVPADTEYDIREALAGLSGLRGVVGYAVPKFWMDETGQSRALGVIHVIAARTSDYEDVKERCSAFLKGRGMDVLVQVEKEGSGRCWCQASRPGAGF